MPITTETRSPNGSHSLALERAYTGETFSKEELYPVIDVTGLPRLGRTVRADFSVDRYVASSYDEATGVSSPVWTEWRIILRDVREIPSEGNYYGDHASGVGDTTRRLIRETCEPLIREWLASDEYTASRRRTAAQAVVGLIDAPRDYSIDRARQVLASLNGDVETWRSEKIAAALDALTVAQTLVTEASAA